MAATYVLIEHKLLSGTSASITFSSITNTYKDLEIRLSARSNSGTYADALYVTFNSDSSNFTRSVYMQSAGTGAEIGTLDRFFGQQAGGNATANLYSGAVIRIPNYANSSYVKPILWFGGVSNISALNGNNFTTLSGQNFNSTAAISSITITPGSGSFVANSRFSLYGISNS